MIEILPESEQDTLALAISGKLSHDDYEKLRPEMKLRAQQMDSFDLLVELSDIDGLEPRAIHDDLQFAGEFAGDIGHMAVVTSEPLWQNMSRYLGKPIGELLGIDVEQFGDRSAAWKWLKS